jgi:hypothetical protein
MALIEDLEGSGNRACKRLQRHRGQRSRRLCIESSIRFLPESHDTSHDRMNLDERWAG